MRRNEPITMWFGRVITACVAICVVAVASAGAAGADGVPVRVELDDGTRSEGMLVDIGPATVRFADAGGGSRSIPLERVRAVVRSDASSKPARGRVGLTLTDGTTLTGDEFSWSGDAALLEGSLGRVKLPLGRVRAVEWRAEGETAVKSWLDAVPEGTTSDLVVIGKEGGYEFVECAISAIGPDTVTVVLDDETIPVKRSKVIGLRWLRSGTGAARGRTLIDVLGGGLRADSITWTPEGLVLDADDAERRMMLPAPSLLRIDYAAGRTTLLTTVVPERLEVEPFFGALASVDGLSAAFAPRPVPADARFEKPGLLVRPRTVAVWRIPPGGRRFRSSMFGQAGGGPSTVTITLDDRPVLEQVVSGGAATRVDLDVTGGRRLGVTVDFGPAGAMAGAVRFEEPVIEQ